MSRRRRGAAAPKSSSPDLLVRSTQDDYELVRAVDERFRDLCHMYRRVRAMELPVPKSMRPEFDRHARVLVRHALEDFRHTPSEIKSVKVIAQWTYDIKRELCGLPSETLELR